jgi:beta-xylosidase
LDAIRVGEDFYAVSSAIHLSPGMAVLHSTDLVNWQIIGQAVPT